MKISFLHRLVSLLFAGIFLFAGTGYNIVQYCCRNCKSTGVEMMVKAPCCCAHACHHNNNAHQVSHQVPTPVQPYAGTDACARDLGKDCNVERLTVDVPSIQIPNKGVVNYLLIYNELVGVPYSSKSLIAASEMERELLYMPSKIPIGREGRQILSQISILII